ncbi:LysR substrate-binding domain-containing protein, partial [Streptomyces sp. NPDC048279]|uniref:LysR substrate-binding domain-containing protein n=1 Tax=Streptomyces sp. NPDC048279 TaxID=3154714 RepID=UPI00343DA237
MTNRVTAGEPDVAVITPWGRPPKPSPHIAVRTLPRDRLAIVLPDDHPPAAGPPEGSPLRPAQLRDESWVTILPGHAAREQLDGGATRPASA